MAARGIKDQVAIVGMGCTRFGEHWDRSVDDMLIEAAHAAYDSAGIAQDDVDAFWFGTLGSGTSGLTLSKPLKIDYKPVTRVENMCATGSEAFRNACLRRRVGRLRHGDGDRCREAQGHRHVGAGRARRSPDDGTKPATHRAGHRSRCSPRPTPRSTASTATR